MRIENSSQKIWKYLQKEWDTPSFLIVFIATDWSGAARMMRPVFKELQEQFEQEAHFIELNTELDHQLQNRLGINKIPSILIFHQHELVDRIEGMMARTVLLQRFEHLLNPKPDTS